MALSFDKRVTIDRSAFGNSNRLTQMNHIENFLKIRLAIFGKIHKQADRSFVGSEGKISGCQHIRRKLVSEIKRAFFANPYLSRLNPPMR